MIGSLIVAAALAGQAAPKPAPAAPPGRPGPAATAKPAVPATQAAPAKSAAAKLIAKRKAKKAGAYAARVDGEAREAQAQAAAEAQAKKEFERLLPYMVEMRGQDLNRLSAAERNAIMNRYLNQGGAQGVQTGAAPQPVRIVNMPGQPLAP